MEDGVLYKVTKIKLERRLVNHETNEYGPYVPSHTKVDYRTNQNAVTLAFRSAQQNNDWADRMRIQRPDYWPARYEVHVEVCQLPTFIEYSKVQGKSSKETLANIIKVT